MTDENQIVSTANLPIATGVSPNAAMSQVGDKNTMIGHVDTLIIQKSFNPVANGRSGKPASIGWQPNTQYYNLFVRREDTPVFDDFLFPKECSLVSCIDPLVKEKFGGLSDLAINQLVMFPTVVASLNRSNGRTDENHCAQYGRISSVLFETAGIRIAFQHMYYLPQQRLNEIPSDLQLKCASLCNELDEPHWTIKEVNLLSVLANAGIEPIY